MKICVFCSSRSNLDETVFAAAKDFCSQLAEKNVTMVYGGGRQGLMGFMADDMLSKGGRVVGVMPEKTFPQEAAHQGLTDLHYTRDMLDRKRVMLDLSDAFVIFPGGIGTMDEALEVLTWKTIYKFEKPILFFNHQGFWNPFLEMLKGYEGTGLFYPETMKAFEVVDDVDGLIRGSGAH